MPRASILTLVVGLVLAGWPAAAAPEEPGGFAPPDTLRGADLDSLAALALARAPEVAALAARRAEAAQRARAAAALPDPMVEVMVQDVGFPDLTVGEREMSMVGAEVRQGLLWPGKRAARRRAADQDAGLAAAREAAARREVVAQVRSLGAQLYALGREREALTSSRELLALLAATTAARYAAGGGRLDDALQRQIEESRVDERLADLAAESAGLAAELNRILDRPGDAAVPPVASLPDVVFPAVAWEEAALAASPDVSVLRAAARAAQARAALVAAESRPNAFAGAGYGHRGGLDAVVTLRLGVELPLWSGAKQKPLVRAAGHAAEAAERDLAAAEAAARAEAVRLRALAARDVSQVARYRDALVPRSAAALDAARAAYLAGEGDVGAVIDAFRTWLDARVGLARREAARYATWARAQALLGGTLPGETEGEGP